MKFTAAVYQWDQATFRPTGNPLAAVQSSSPILNGPTQYLNNFDKVTISPNVQLAAGQQYVVLFTTLGVAQPFYYGGTSFGVTPVDTYNGGEMVFSSAGTLHEASTSVGTIESERWGDSGTCDQLNLSSLCTPSSYLSAFGENVAPDLAFSAEFTSPVPEPSSFAVLSLGLIALMTKLRSSTTRR